MIRILALIALALGLAAPAQALASRCYAFVQGVPGVHYATLGPVAAAIGEVDITYVGHSTFLIESPAGVTIATDYNDAVRPRQTPMVATMNRAHSSHFSFAPDPDIEHLLPDRKSTRLNSSHSQQSRMPSSA